MALKNPIFTHAVYIRLHIFLKREHIITIDVIRKFPLCNNIPILFHMSIVCSVRDLYQIG